MSNSEAYIAGRNKRADWLALRERLIRGDEDAWVAAFADFFKTRLELRYLHPIKLLQQHGTLQGEGFSIAAIQCSLIEFLESTAKGLRKRCINPSWIFQRPPSEKRSFPMACKISDLWSLILAAHPCAAGNAEYFSVSLNYRYIAKGQKLRPYEYSNSKELFVAFLRTREPFSETFNEDDTARDFYTSVRCGLLHEARTKNGWKVWAGSEEGPVANVPSKTLYRDGFQSALLQYIQHYGIILQEDAAYKCAFIRKFDALCE